MLAIIPTVKALISVWESPWDFSVRIGREKKQKIFSFKKGRI